MALQPFTSGELDRLCWQTRETLLFFAALERCSPRIEARLACEIRAKERTTSKAGEGSSGPSSVALRDDPRRRHVVARLETSM